MEHCESVTVFHFHDLKNEMRQLRNSQSKRLTQLGAMVVDDGTRIYFSKGQYKSSFLETMDEILFNRFPTQVVTKAWLLLICYVG